MTTRARPPHLASNAAQATLLRTVSERDWQQSVLELACLNRWLSYHAPDNRPDRDGRLQAVTPGFPDLVLARGKRLVFAELKREVGGRVSTAQEAWLHRLRCTGAEGYIWRPSDIDRVRQVLGRDESWMTA